MLSVEANPNCESREQAERAVNEVWESCFKDTRPFDEVSIAQNGLAFTLAYERERDHLGEYELTCRQIYK